VDSATRWPPWRVREWTAPRPTAPDVVRWFGSAGHPMNRGIRPHQAGWFPCLACSQRC